MDFEKHKSHNFWQEPLSNLPLGFSRKESQTVLILLQNSAVAGQNTLEKNTFFKEGATLDFEKHKSLQYISPSMTCYVIDFTNKSDIDHTNLTSEVTKGY